MKWPQIIIIIIIFLYILQIQVPTFYAVRMTGDWIFQNSKRLKRHYKSIIKVANIVF